MTPRYPLLQDEPERLDALRALQLLDTPGEERFDRITRTAQRLFRVPIATLTLVDADRQWFKSCQGLTGRENPRDASFCAHAIAADEVMVVPDAVLDARFADNPLVTGDPHIRFYAGKPLRGPTGHRIGTLCVIDRRPRTFTAEDIEALTDLGGWADLELTVSDVGRAARERDQLRRRLQTIVQVLPQGLLVLDRDRRVAVANRAASDMTGRTADDLVGRPLDELVAGGVVRRPDGSGPEVTLTTVPLEDDDSGDTVAMLTDVTEARAVERLKDEIISITGHELRTPLTAIAGALGLLAGGVGGPLSADGQHLVDTARRNADRLVRLVNNMLDLERLGSGRMPMDCSPVDLAEVAAAAADGLAGIAAAAGVRLVTDLRPARTVGDRDRLIQVATNLLDNAIKHSPAGRDVTLRTCTAGPAAVLAVEDRGPGIPLEDRRRIFDRFTQLDSGADRASTGSGLGLAIVSGIVDAHAGSVSVSSVPEAGSTFTVSLPRDQDALVADIRTNRVLITGEGGVR